MDKGKKYIAAIYAGTDNADWKSNPEGYKIKKFIVDDSIVLKLKLAKGGGAAISIMPATADKIKSVKTYH